jgi:hypothetical protein
MKNFFALFMLLLLVFQTSVAFAWGSKGHKLVARIATTQLKPAVKDSLSLYLDKMNLEDAATWMDDVRGDHTYDYQTTWHYIDMDKGTTYSDTSTNNAVWAIHKAIHEIENRGSYSKLEIATDIKILFHLVGDIHQPLHAAYPADQGGNKVIVYIDQTSSNLHRVWDTNILEDYILPQPLTWTNLSKYSPEEIAQMKDTSVVDWMNESRSYLDQAYDFKHDIITKQYIEANKPVIEKRLLFAGVRLGRLLNRLFN